MIGVRTKKKKKKKKMEFPVVPESEATLREPIAVACDDLRNVMRSMSPEEAEAFLSMHARATGAGEDTGEEHAGQHSRGLGHFLRAVSRCVAEDLTNIFGGPPPDAVSNRLRARVARCLTLLCASANVRTLIVSSVSGKKEKKKNCWKKKKKKKKKNRLVGWDHLPFNESHACTPQFSSFIYDSY
jgi:hypothetical protein